MAGIIKLLDDLMAFYLAAPPGGSQRAKVEQLFTEWQRKLELRHLAESRSGLTPAAITNEPQEFELFEL